MKGRKKWDKNHKRQKKKSKNREMKRENERGRRWRVLLENKKDGERRRGNVEKKK